MIETENSDIPQLSVEENRILRAIFFWKKRYMMLLCKWRIIKHRGRWIPSQILSKVFGRY
jgi:hypothetical protein